MFLFIFQHPFFSRQRTLAVLAPLLFALGLMEETLVLLLARNGLAQHFPSLLTVKKLCAKFLTLDYNSGWFMVKHHASGHLINILAART